MFFLLTVFIVRKQFVITKSLLLQFRFITTCPKLLAPETNWLTSFFVFENLWNPVPMCFIYARVSQFFLNVIYARSNDFCYVLQTFQFVQILLNVWCPNLDIVIQVRQHYYWIEENCFPSLWCDSPVSTSQHAVSSFSWCSFYLNRFYPVVV